MTARGGEAAVAAGVDGCRAGWVAALAYGTADRVDRTELRLFAGIDELMRWREAEATMAVVAIDVPIGLPRRVGLRPCDAEARARLGRRWMCVFEPPDRELFGHDFEAARAIVYARRARDPLATFHVLTQQGVHILDKVAEVDRVLGEDPSRRAWLVEVHPEVSFRALVDEDLPRKKSSSGKAWRRAALRDHFTDIEERLEDVRWLRREVGYDDILDAYAALWSASRFVRDDHVQLGNGELDERGLPMRMVV